MDVRISKQNGSTTLLSDINVVAQDFNVSSIELIPSYGSVEGRSGTVDYGATYGSRTITVPFYLEANGSHDYSLIRDRFFGLVTDLESFYIEELRYNEFETGVNELVGGKRYLVRLNNVIDLDQQFKFGFGEMEFVTTELPFAESVETTAFIDENGLDASDARWGFGMGLLPDESSWVYTHNATAGTTFRVYNAGDVDVHPFEQDLKMTISNVQGSDEMFQITNHTNSSRARVEVPVKTSDSIVYDGPTITRNSLAFLRDTRRDFVELSPGWNTFQIYYCDSARISFDFRFYYK